MSTSGDSLNTIPGTLSIGKIAATGTPGATNYLRGDGIWDGISTTDISATGTANALSVLRGDGVWATGYHRSLSITYISGTGTAGTDNTQMTVKSLTLPANTLTQVGDRMRLRAYVQATSGPPIISVVQLNGVISGAKTLVNVDVAVQETWWHYIDNTHSNILETGGAPGYTLLNVAGFDWGSDQALLISQTKIAAQHIIVGVMIVDFFPKAE
jgi:hypothetical protein